MGISDCAQITEQSLASPGTVSNSHSERPLTNATESMPDIPEDDTDLALHLARLRQTRRVIRRIPKGARIPAADAMTALIDKAVEQNTELSWARLLLFPFLALCVPVRETTKELKTPL